MNVSIIILVITSSLILFSNCSELRSRSASLESSDQSNFNTSAVKTPTLTLDALNSNCNHAGIDNFDPEDMDYIMDPDNEISYKFNQAYGMHDNNADGFRDADPDGDGRGTIDSYFNRRVVDVLYKADGPPQPLVIYFHGGGFTSGDKCLPYTYRQVPLKDIFEVGAAFATANYRLLSYFTETGEPVVYENTKGFITSLKDGQRVIQYMRLHARRFNIDPNRIYLMGESAGAGIALWNATRDEAAIPKSSSAIQRMSTRVSAIFGFSGQATYDFHKWETEVFGKSSDYMYGRWREDTKTANQMGYTKNFHFDECYYLNFDKEKIDCEDPDRPMKSAFSSYEDFAAGLYALYNSQGSGDPSAEIGTTEYQVYLDDTAAQRADVDMLGQLSADDPAIYMDSFNADNTYPVLLGALLHSRYHVDAVRKKAKDLGVVFEGHVGYQRDLDVRWLRAQYFHAVFGPK